MTDMLQKSENVTNNVANENSQDLTEQWKKGELPDGHYYVKDGENMIAEYLDGYFYNDGNPMTSFSGGVDEVLAPVPSYDEWQASYNCMLENEVLRLKNAQLKERVSKLEKMQYSYTSEEWNTMLRTVNRTKELLKECKECIEWYKADCGYQDAPTNAVLTKIDEVLK